VVSKGFPRMHRSGIAAFQRLSIVSAYPRISVGGSEQQAAGIRSRKDQTGAIGRPFEHYERCHSCGDRFRGNDEGPTSRDKRLYLYARRSHRRWHAGDVRRQSRNAME